MPIMSGTELLRIMTDHNRLSRVPVLVLSGSAKAPSTQHAAVVGVFSKPFDATVFVETVRAQVGNPESQRNFVGHWSSAWRPRCLGFESFPAPVELRASLAANEVIKIGVPSWWAGLFPPISLDTTRHRYPSVPALLLRREGSTPLRRRCCRAKAAGCPSGFLPAPSPLTPG
jgi:hypothetical protein